jgi:hypothetical protein
MGVSAVLALLVMVPGCNCKLFNQEDHFEYRRYGLGLRACIRAKRDEVHAQPAERAWLFAHGRSGPWMGRKPRYGTVKPP